MAAVDNRSLFPHAEAVLLDEAGADVLVVCVAGRFSLRPAGAAAEAAVVGEQKAPVMADVYWGEPGRSSLRYEGQGSLPRPGTDITVAGHAWGRRGRPVTELMTAARIGDYKHHVLVVGDRAWQRRPGTTTPTPPRPFDRMPLLYERSFGGASPTDPWVFDGRNPVGRGYYAEAPEVADRPLPNLEDPRQRITSIRDRPAPAGFGPIARSWEPRIRYAGTYDQTWLAERAPLWPADLDRRFFAAAPSPLQARGQLHGGEPILLVGMSPDGDVQSLVPRWRLEAKTILRTRIHRAEMGLDALVIEPDEGVLTVTWRAFIPVHDVGGMAEHEVTIIRASAQPQR